MDPTTALDKIKARIRKAAAQAGRSPEAIRLLAVSKGKPAEAIRNLAGAGHTAFGENYLQEALDKQGELLDLRGLEWHFIGPLQSNKTRGVAEHFDWVHSVDRVKIARRLHQQRPDSLAPLNVCIQVNTSGEPQKAGLAAAELGALAEAIRDLPRLRLRGLMCLPAPDQGTESRRAEFRQLRELKASLEAKGHPLDTLSMGMSADLEDAIREGSTLVRVGSALFGAREPG
ncbi:YggS family pyridoxal phosphate-dependent enzyme [Natronospira bacteriovora]|uniref:Pyridoxal phosphate homeostasis protein n=1 Tax=Natronospira bacteriovora TaxID=3069753 RepID=A0ABU0W9B6_9GAMM|nr:YggS family pyridoxal phosphate-dependent enzyme [Natronospira sp. AB-CW4]MDQ2070621.1 YggS family pyridoxal phosphate-dependent enzyme [Natronospira sp. AB-CW4]